MRGVWNQRHKNFTAFERDISSRSLPKWMMIIWLDRLSLDLYRLRKYVTYRLCTCQCVQWFVSWSSCDSQFANNSREFVLGERDRGALYIASSHMQLQLTLCPCFPLCNFIPSCLNYSICKLCIYRGTLGPRLVCVKQTIFIFSLYQISDGRLSLLTSRRQGG